MTEEQYQEFLKTAPEDHFSDEFRLFLINNNKVREVSSCWTIIENKKYWTPENDWLTAFSTAGNFKDHDKSSIANFMPALLHKYGDREWLIKAPSKRTVKLFHVHLIKKQ